MSNELIDESPMPPLHRYGVGDCIMLEDDNGPWIRTDQLIDIIEWLTANDDRDVILKKLEHLKESV